MIARVSPSRLLISLVAAATVVGTAATHAVAAGDAPPPASAHAAGPGTATTVTLVTGDRVTVTPRAGGTPKVLIDAADDHNSGFSVATDHGDVRVVPHDVAALVPDVLDPALFDVTGLIAMGYDDTKTPSIPLIVKHAAGVRTLRSSSPLRTRRELTSIGAESAGLAKSAAPAFGRDLTAARSASKPSTELAGADKVWLDRRTETDSLDTYLERVHAPYAWDSGLDGSGVKVAVLDTGIDAGHPALTGAVSDSANFTDEPTTDDGNGHGTHVASLIVGNGAGSDGARHGVADKANLLVGKVLDSDGRGYESDLIAGLEWAAGEGADVVNVSLGARSDGTDDPGVQAVDRLTAETGTLFVVAAGNDGSLGPSPYSIGTPGTAPDALTVAATQDNDGQAGFSSEGPTRGSYRLKPDVAAPGVNILGARAGARTGDLYTSLTGTSQATPIVAGSAALLLQKHPDWSPAQIKTRLMNTADVIASSQSWTVGAGRVNLEDALTEPVTADVGALDFGYLKHPDEAARTQTVTLTNHGDAAVTLDATDKEANETGKAAPQAAVTVSPTSVTVPADGTASVQVRLDPEIVDDTRWQGYVTFGTADHTELQLPFSVYDEPERYDLDLTVLDRDGKPYTPEQSTSHPLGDSSATIFNGTTGGYQQAPINEDGTVSARLAPGRYSVFVQVATPLATGGASLSIVGTPEVSVTKDTALTLDARDTSPLVAPKIPGHATKATEAMMMYRRGGDGKGYTSLVSLDAAEVAAGTVFVTPSKPVTAGTFGVVNRWRLEPVGTPDKGQPDAYELVQPDVRFSAPADTTLTQREVKQLAHVTDRHHALGSPGDYIRGDAYTVGFFPGIVHRRTITAPTTEVEWMTASDDVIWNHCIITPEESMREQCTRDITYPKGGTTDADWNEVLQPDVQSTYRSSTQFSVQTGAGDGVHIGGFAYDGLASNKLVLRKTDGTVLGQTTLLSGLFTVPQDVRDLRLTQKLRLSTPLSARRFTAVTTSWRFHSEPPANPSLGGAPTPALLDVDYTPSVNDLGLAKRGKALAVTLRFQHLPGTEATDKIAKATGSWSANAGRTWVTPTLKRLDDETFRITVPKKAVRAGGSLSFKVQARDQEGNAVNQTVMELVPVK